MPRIYVLTFSNIYCILSVDKGGIKNMATESIFTNIVLSDPKEVQMLIDALEASKKDLKKETKPSIAPLLTDLDEIRRRFDNRLKKING